MTENEDLNNCEQCYQFYYHDRIDKKPGPVVLECTECGNPWAYLWPEVTSSISKKKQWPEKVRLIVSKFFQSRNYATYRI